MAGFPSYFFVLLASVLYPILADNTTSGYSGFTVFIPLIRDCWCSCEPAQLSEEDAQYVSKWKAGIKAELLVDEQKLSATKRKLTSAEDKRVSATSVGCMGVVTLTVVVLAIACMDLTNLKILANFFKGINL